MVRDTIRHLIEEGRLSTWLDEDEHVESFETIRARLSQAGAGGGVAAGWKQVPITPTRAMKDAVSRKVDDFARESVRLFTAEVWQDMLDAAPTPPATPAQPTASVEARPLKDFAQPGQCNCGDCLRIRQAADLDRRRASLTPATPVSEPSPSAGEPVAWPWGYQQTFDAIGAAVATIIYDAMGYERRGAPVDIDGKPYGSWKVACDAAAAVLAALTPAQTQGDGGLIPTPAIRTCGPIAPMVEPFDDKWLGDGDSVHVLPTPSAPVSAPSPAGEVREALGKIDLRVLSDVQRLGDGVSFGGSNDRVRAISLIERGFLSGSYQNAKLTEAGRAALSSPATPEPVSAPANGEVVDQAEINRIRDWLLERNHDHLLAAQENRITMMRVRSDTEMFLDAAILLSHLAALSNPAHGHGEAVPVAWRHFMREPDGTENIMLSPSADNPWSHWMAEHRAKCTYECTPLYTRAATGEKPAPATGKE